VRDLLANVERHWEKQRISHGPPASPSQLDEFETRYGVNLPDDLRAYFDTLNGSELGSNGPMDDHLLSFWHLSEIRSLAEERSADTPPSHRSSFVFADHSIGVHAYAVRLSPDARAPAPVSVIYDELQIEVSPSFRTFLERYLAGDIAVLFPDLPPK
jgi:hypothetical protein